MPKGKMFCFSPPVMMATFIIEIAMALFVLWRYKASQLTRLVVLLLTFLAIFQLAEYMVCGGLGLTAMTWSRIGFAAITMLPPIGIHMAYTLAKRNNLPIIAASYSTAILYILYFIFAPSAFAGQACLGNYVIFQLTELASWMYGIYYYGLVLLGLWLCFTFARKTKVVKMRNALQLFGFGYCAFIIPTTVANLLDEATLQGIPSIMCGFAVLMAIIIVFGVLPSVDKIKRKRHTIR